MVVIPAVLGMLTTLLILSIVIGPPTVIIGAGRIPPTLIIVSYDFTTVGNTKILRINVSNPGDASLYVTEIYVNGKCVLRKYIEVEAHTQVKEISFALPKIRGSKLNVTILYAPEVGSLNSTQLFIELPKK
ncbi:MAG: hypothetical protein B6U89_06450 [Desulfurococcales archaeon ex4484_58]|nr:MAG: hypothetical protein B6U89_06450 [Desulfurococcales archaeon ex4484_58]